MGELDVASVPSGEPAPVARSSCLRRPPRRPQAVEALRSVPGSLALVAAGIVGYFVVQVIGGIFIAIWLLTHGTPLNGLTESALAPYLPSIIAFSPIASLAILGVLALAKQLAPDPREPRASPVASALVAVLSAAGTIGCGEVVSLIQQRLGSRPEEQTVILEAFKVCPRWMLYGAVAFLAPLGEELISAGSRSRRSRSGRTGSSPTRSRRSSSRRST